jgi:predicted negative regulator of RcsB-dependent stress response
MFAQYYWQHPQTQNASAQYAQIFASISTSDFSFQNYTIHAILIQHIERPSD